MTDQSASRNSVVEVGKVAGLPKPFAVYEDYAGKVHIIDGGGRIVLSDNFAYDNGSEARDMRMDKLVDALNGAAVSEQRRWIPVSERMPDSNTWVLVHNGKWTGIGRHCADEHLQSDEKWQDEHTQFIELLGPKVTHWMHLPPAPSAERNER